MCMQLLFHCTPYHLFFKANTNLFLYIIALRMEPQRSSPRLKTLHRGRNLMLPVPSQPHPSDDDLSDPVLFLNWFSNFISLTTGCLLSCKCNTIYVAICVAILLYVAILLSLVCKCNSMYVCHCNILYVTIFSWFWSSFFSCKLNALNVAICMMVLDCLVTCKCNTPLCCNL